MELPLPPRSEIKIAEVTTKMVSKIKCPHCSHTWEETSNPDDETGYSIFDEGVYSCLLCGKWYAVVDDDLLIDMFYESYEEDLDADLDSDQENSDA